MNRWQISSILCIACLSVLGMEARACDPKPRPCVTPRTPAPNRPTTPPPPVVEGDDGGEVDWDLPAETKRRITKEATARTPARTDRSGSTHPGVRPPTSTPTDRATTERRAVRTTDAGDEAIPNRNDTARPEGPSHSQRMAQAVEAQRALAAANVRLDAKRRELQRWDAEAQEKFRRAFGTTDERVRRAVLQRIDEQKERNQRLLAAITDGMNFEFYMQTKKAR
jgi:type IV secretory pathway VirB10-like protein